MSGNEFNFKHKHYLSAITQVKELSHTTPE